MKSDPFIQIFLQNRFKNVLSFSFAFTCNLVAALLEGISFAFFLFGINAIMGGESLSLTPLQIFQPFLKNSPLQIFVLSIVLGVTSQALRSLFNFIGLLNMTFLGTRLQTEGQRQIYEQIFRLSFRCLSRYKVGDLVEYAKTPVLLVVPLMDAFNRVVLSALMIASLIIFMLYISSLLTLIIVLMFGLVAISQKSIIKKISNFSTLNANNIVELTKHTVQNLYGLKAVLTFGRQKDILYKIHKSLDEIADSTVKTNALNQFISPFNEMVGIVFVGASLLIAVFILKKNELVMIPQLLTFLTLTYRLGTRVPQLMNAWSSIAFNMGHIHRLREILDDREKEFCNEAGTEFTSFTKEIELRNISLTYDQKPAVNKVNLTIAKGQVIALVGSSGAGKSSIIDLLIRLYNPSYGKILIDGLDLSSFSVRSWRNNLGVVSQDSIIFNESIEENIRFGLVSAHEDQVIEAAKMAGAHDFILELPNQYKTIVGERGYKLSGGEKQRVALARALIRDPKILILDEATSSLDSHSEAIIQNALEKLKKSKTIILVAHRLSTVTMADQIYVLEKGEIVEQGTHFELLEKEGRYHYYWLLQAKSGLKTIL